ncbi:hypothetical protein QFC24_002743 [Naganishia onofrii]|uniref:Uncharacterized protein n=1 Tax=Naganishia onofrii TaxID=1851511 RepID=A0ACC2XQT2_9TREE|nr:hypothetical protein QFC24_002743 [Naganishia onofrii]
MSRRVVPFGPNPPYPILSQRALWIAYSVILRNERVFLSKLEQWWHFHSDPRGQAIVFEILCFLAGLKPAVMVGWGDGASADALAGQNWIWLVWDQFVKSLGEGSGKDKDLNQLREFTAKCKWHRLKDQQGDTAQMTGHYLLYHDRPGPAIKVLIDPGVYDAYDTTYDDGVVPEIDEAIYANVFDYPVPLPKEAFWQPAGTGIRTQLVTIGIVYREEIQLGTQWVAKNTKTHEQLCRAHLERYRQRLKGVIPRSDLAISFNGIWEFPADCRRSALGNPAELDKKLFADLVAIYRHDGVADLNAMDQTWKDERPMATPSQSQSQHDAAQ